MRQYIESKGKSEYLLGENLANGELVVAEQENPAATLFVANHEFAHRFGFRSIEIRRGHKGANSFSTRVARIGYSTQSPPGHEDRGSHLHMLNEIVTEKLNQVLVRQYWPRQPVLADAARKLADTSSYHADEHGAAMPLGEKLVQRVAHDSGREPEEVWRDLMRGALTGDMKALKPLQGAFGTEGMRDIVHYTKNDVRVAGALAVRLGV